MNAQPFYWLPKGIGVQGEEPLKLDLQDGIRAWFDLGFDNELTSRSASGSVYTQSKRCYLILQAPAELSGRIIKRALAQALKDKRLAGQVVRLSHGTWEKLAGEFGSLKRPSAKTSEVSSFQKQRSKLIAKFRPELFSKVRSSRRAPRQTVSGMENRTGVIDRNAWLVREFEIDCSKNPTTRFNDRIDRLKDKLTDIVKSKNWAPLGIDRIKRIISKRGKNSKPTF